MISVIAKIDQASRARLSWIQSFAASFGIVPKPISGHITLARMEGERDAAAAACQVALAGQAAFAVEFQKVEVLPGEKAVAALAAREGVLEELHGKLVPDGDWTPGIVLLRDNLVDLNWVRMAMGQMFQPFTAKVERIEWMDDGEVIGGMDLKGETA